MERGDLVAGWDSCASVVGVKGIEIAGGGLAGLSLGIALQDRCVPVVIREAGSYPRHKVCGEFVNGVSPETLENLRIDVIFEEALLHSKTRWWMGDEELLEAEMKRPALGLSRWEMDEALRDLFLSKGGKLQVKDRVERVAREGLVWTAGRVLQNESKWLGLKGHFIGLELDGLEMHLGEGGYVGLTPVRGGRVNVCGLFEQRNLRGGNVILTYLDAVGLGALSKRLSKVEFDRKSLTGISGFGLGGQDGNEELLTLGDAERIIPPFTGNGMSMAFESAECALEPLLNYAQGGLGWGGTCQLIRKSLAGRFDRRVRLAQTMHHFLNVNLGRQCLKWTARANLLPFHWLHRRLT